MKATLKDGTELEGTATELLEFFTDKEEKIKPATVETIGTCVKRGKYKKRTANKYKVYSRNEDNLIMSLKGTMSAKKIAKKLGRTTHGIASRIWLLEHGKI